MVLLGVAALVFVAGMRRLSALVLGIICAGLLVLGVYVLAGNTVVNNGYRLAVRGQNGQLLSSATGRTPLWKGEISVWEESPLIGHGLISASRYEVIEPLGGELNQAHSTWFESLGGTGVLGTLSLLSALAAAGVALFRRRLMFPIALWVALLILSVTDGGLAYVSYPFLMFLVLISFAATKGGRALPSQRANAPAGA
jgi:O-antigen ligase